MLIECKSIKHSLKNHLTSELYQLWNLATEASILKWPVPIIQIYANCFRETEPSLKEDRNDFD